MLALYRPPDALSPKYLGITQIKSTSAIQGSQQLADPLAVAGALQGNLVQAAANMSRGVTAGRQPVGLLTLQDDSLRCHRSGICEGVDACAQGEHCVMIRRHCGLLLLLCLSLDVVCGVCNGSWAGSNSCAQSMRGHCYACF